MGKVDGFGSFFFKMGKNENTIRAQVRSTHNGSQKKFIWIAESYIFGTKHKNVVHRSKAENKIHALLNKDFTPIINLVWANSGNLFHAF